MDVFRQDRELGYKQTADKIRQILSKVRETPRSSYKRWVWELMQNAKDVKDPAFGSVSIKIKLSNEQLQFSHNGLPFKVRHLLGIVKQVSTKSSANEDEEVTGKFGTGFIVTHLLSDTIDIQGYIHDDQNDQYYRLGNLRLDRSGNTSEELIPKIEEANEYILKVVDDRQLFPLVPGYGQAKSKHNFDTVFTYTLSSDRKKEAAVEGVADLKNTLPVTLVSVEEVSEVFIESEIDGKLSHYQMEVVLNFPEVKWLRVNQDGITNRNFIKFIKDSYCLIAEVEDFQNFALVERPDDQPVLYRNFPLIGSEQFHFPFVLNGFEFNPTEDRNDIVLVNEESTEVLYNRAVLQEAVDGVIEFTEYLIGKNASNRHLCAFSRIPKLTVPIEDGLKDWLIELQTSWRERLLDFELVATQEGNYIRLRDCKIPNHGQSKEQKVRFHELVVDFLGAAAVPNATENLAWISVTGPKSELESWGIDLWYGLEELLTELSNLESLEALEERVEDPIAWLNKLYAFIHDVKEIECYESHAIIPNHLGDFDFLANLNLEDPESKIPESFLDILVSIGDDWRSKIIHRGAALVGVQADKKGLADVSKFINDFLQKKNYSSGYQDFYSNPQRLEIVVSIVKQFDQQHPNDFRSKIFLRAKELYQLDEELQLMEDVSDFQFSTALKYLIEFMHGEIEAYENLEAFAAHLNMSEAATINWLDEYYHILLEKEDFKTMIEVGNIIPNREGVFCAYEDLYAFGTEEVPLDEELIDILHALDESQNWRTELLCEGLTIHRPAKKFDELGSAIDLALRELEKEEAFNPGSLDAHKQVIYKLIDWCRLHPQHTENYLKHTGSRSNDLWVKFSMTPEIMSILRDEGSLALLQGLADANLNASDKQKVIQIAQQFAQLSADGKWRLERLIEDLLEVELDFAFKLAVGSNVEKALQEALVTAGLNANQFHIERFGVGAFDFVITNILNRKQFFIELKSHKAGIKSSLKLAPSQAKFSLEHPDNYALLYLERPADLNDVTIEFIIQNLKAKNEVKNLVEQGVSDYFRFEEIQKADHLHLSLREAVRINVNLKNFIDFGYGFVTLVSKIKVHLQ